MCPVPCLRENTAAPRTGTRPDHLPLHLLGKQEETGVSPCGTPRGQRPQGQGDIVGAVSERGSGRCRERDVVKVGT